MLPWLWITLGWSYGLQRGKGVGQPRQSVRVKFALQIWCDSAFLDTQMAVKHQGMVWKSPEKNDYPRHLTFELRTPRPRGSASRILEGPGAPRLVSNSGQSATHEPINPLFQQLLQLPASLPPVKSRTKDQGLCLRCAWPTFTITRNTWKLNNIGFHSYPTHLRSGRLLWDWSAKVFSEDSSDQQWRRSLSFNVMNTRVLARSGSGALKPRLGESTLT